MYIFVNWCFRMNVPYCKSLCMTNVINTKPTFEAIYCCDILPAYALYTVNIPIYKHLSFVTYIF